MAIKVKFIHSKTSYSAKLLAGFFLLTFVMVGAKAQSSYTLTDAYTPREAAPGSPAGSYALSGFDNVNIFSGHLNFRLPLLNVGGRGQAGYQMMLPIERIWHLRRIIETDGDYVYLPEDITWNGLKPGFGPGVMEGRQISQYLVDSNTCNLPANGIATTTLSFIAPDGTEHQFVDALTAGKYLSWTYYPCNQPYLGASRGRVFVTRDGSAATFISDSEIRDEPQAANLPDYRPTGYLLWKNGTRYRIETGIVKWIRDRNGNKTDFTYSFVPVLQQSVTEITDSLNRKITIAYRNTAIPYDEITFFGYQGAARSIKIYYSSLQNRLRQPSYPLPCKTLGQLFPEVSPFFAEGTVNSIVNPTVVSFVELPNHKTYQFYYNYYGEIARVELPTGGAYEYDVDGYDRGSGLGRGSGHTGGPNMLRRLVTKRIYSSSGVAEREELYRDAQNGTFADLNVVVEHKALNQTTPLAKEQHFFIGGLGSGDYSYWTLAKIRPNSPPG